MPSTYDFRRPAIPQIDVTHNVEGEDLEVGVVVAPSFEREGSLDRVDSPFPVRFDCNIDTFSIVLSLAEACPGAKCVDDILSEWGFFIIIWKRSEESLDTALAPEVTSGGVFTQMSPPCLQVSAMRSLWS